MSRETTLPLFLDLAGRLCLVIGGDVVAVQKTADLLRAGAAVTIVARELVPELQSLVLAGTILWVDQPFQEAMLDSAWLVVAVSADPLFNQRLQEAAFVRRIFLNIVDQPDYCSVIWPAILRRPPITLAISTQGSAPVLAGWLRRHLDEVLPDQLSELAVWMARHRSQLVFLTHPQRVTLWNRLIDCYLDEVEEAATRLLVHVCRQKGDGDPL